MTRKDCILIAAALKGARCVTDTRTTDYADGCRTQAHVTTIYIASAMEAENPLFDRAKFLKACGVTA